MAGELSALVDSLVSRCDGPVTPFQVISRACRIAATGRESSITVAGACLRALEECGWLVDGEIPSNEGC
jgi:hypothetical protein